MDGVKVLNATAVSITSPSTAIVVTGAYLVTLNSDENLTGLVPTGAVLNQVIELQSGAGSNTMQFDDGTSMTTGANFVITEGQGDSLILRCVNAGGNSWLRVNNNN
jgi:hypothetical protein